MNDIERFIDTLIEPLKLGREGAAELKDELQDHLELLTMDFESEGDSPEAARRRAIEEFGDSEAFARDFHSVNSTYRKRWMMRFTTLAIVGTFAMLIVGYSIWPSNARIAPATQSAAQDESPNQESNANANDDQAPIVASVAMTRNAKTYQVLETDADLDFEDDPISDVLVSLRNTYQINVLLDQSARDDQLTEDELVSFQCKGVRLKTALDLMLAKYNATLMVKEGVVILISNDVVDDPPYFERSIIDVRSLLSKIESYEANKRRAKPKGNVLIFTGPQAVAGQLQPMSGSGGVFQMQEPADRAPMNSKAAQQNMRTVAKLKSNQDPNHEIVLRGPISVVQNDRMDPEQMLKDLVKSSVETDSWHDGQGEGSIDIVGGQMVVNNKRTAIEQIRDLVNDLEFSMSQKMD